MIGWRCKSFPFSWLAGILLTPTFSLQAADILVHWLFLYTYWLGGERQMCFAIFITSTHTYKCLLWGGWFGFWLALKSWFDFLLAAVFLMQSVFPSSAALWPWALLGACVKADLVPEVHLARLEVPSPGGPWGCARARALLLPRGCSAAHRGAGHVWQELQEWDLRLGHEFAKFL